MKRSEKSPARLRSMVHRFVICRILNKPSIAGQRIIKGQLAGKGDYAMSGQFAEDAEKCVTGITTCLETLFGGMRAYNTKDKEPEGSFYPSVMN